MSVKDVFAFERVHQAGGSLLWSSLRLVVKRRGRCGRKKPPNQDSSLQAYQIETNFARFHDQAPFIACSMLVPV
jgi:hypothetical protein